mgnify:CR=1 FL=1
MKMILNGASKFYQPITLTEIEEEKNMEITNEIIKQKKVFTPSTMEVKVFTPSTMEVKAFLKIKELASKQSLNEFEIITMVQLQDFIKTSYRSRLTQM